MSLPITPQTKVGALLEAYPGIEEVLIQWSPAFSKLKNPILRRTVAKVATLEQAARIGGVPVRELVLKLRDATGQKDLGPIEESSDIRGVSGEAPAWLNPKQVRKRIDADSMLERGVHPLGAVQESLVSLRAGEIVELTSAFRPEPLIQAMERGGLGVYSKQSSPGRHVTYFCRVSADPGLAKRVAAHSCESGDCGETISDS